MKLPRAQGRLNEFMAVLFSAKVHHYNKVIIFQPSGSSVLRCFVIYLGYNPRKGAKTPIVKERTFKWMYNPRKGAKTHINFHFSSREAVQSPQGGENLFYDFFAFWAVVQSP